MPLEILTILSGAISIFENCQKIAKFFFIFEDYKNVEEASSLFENYQEIEEDFNNFFKEGNSMFSLRKYWKMFLTVCCVVSFVIGITIGPYVTGFIGLIKEARDATKTKNTEDNGRPDPLASVSECPDFSAVQLYIKK